MQARKKTGGGEASELEKEGSGSRKSSELDALVDRRLSERLFELKTLAYVTLFVVLALFFVVLGAAAKLMGFL